MVSCATMSWERQVYTRLPGQCRRGRRRRVEVAEQQGHLLRAVEGVRLLQRVRADPELLRKPSSSSFGLIGARGRAGRAPLRSARWSSSPPRRPSAGGTAGCPPTAPSRPARAAAGRRGPPGRSVRRRSMSSTPKYSPSVAGSARSPARPPDCVRSRPARVSGGSGLLRPASSLPADLSVTSLTRAVEAGGEAGVDGVDAEPAIGRGRDVGHRVERCGTTSGTDIRRPVGSAARMRRSATG